MKERLWHVRMLQALLALYNGGKPGDAGEDGWCT